MTQLRHPKISKAKARLMLQHPFFATLLLRTEIVLRDDLPYKTAATDGEHIYFDPDFLETLSVEDTMCVLCHEVGHDSLLHSLRLENRNHDLWNQACDHAINLMLLDQGFKEPPSGWLADTKYKGMSADKIYDDLRRNPPPKQPQGGDGKPGAGKPGRWLEGDVMPNKAAQSGDPAKAAVAEQRAKQRVAAAATAARMVGKLKGDLARMVEEALETKVQWTDVLRDFMLRVVKSRESWNHRNKRFAHIYLPRRHDKQMGPIVFIPDTSGSMWGDDMEKICSEMAACAAQTNPENITVLWTDTRVAGEQVFTPDEFAYDKLRPVGGGGTDMRVGLKHAETLDPQVVVLMTDGYTPWPNSEPPYPLIVIATTPHGARTAPIGTVIEI